MDTAELNSTIAPIPQEDGAIDNAINDLDAKIAAWVAAMDKASVALAQVARAETSVAKDNHPGSSDAVADKVSPKAVVQLPGGEPKKSKAPEPPKSRSGLGAKLRKLVGGSQPSEQKENAMAEVASKTNKHASSTGVEKSTKAPSQADDNEALLAQLDPKVAKSVRIKRRLSRGKKSVRDILNES
ncbi:MAG: hypothetical protein GXP29_08970 [Planctomycetes bacterium]|nr:hypothetical protein [Planctomycetota bacterium]